MSRTRTIAMLCLFCSLNSGWVAADEPKAPIANAQQTARVAPFHGYTQAIELTRGTGRAVLCPEVGGRVLVFSVDGKDAMYLDDQEKAWQPGKPAQSSAGRFDYGPELTVIPPTLPDPVRAVAELTVTADVIEPFTLSVPPETSVGPA